MKVNIYYGGRGIVEDPTLFAISKVQEVLDELRVETNVIKLCEHKDNINMLPETLNDLDGVILATTVEWLGIGGNMQSFLDACWLYGDKDNIKDIYMFPIVLSTTYGERDAEAYLSKAWDLLGGMPINGIVGYVEDTVEFETNNEYVDIIEKKAEYFYRLLNQRSGSLPSSAGYVPANKPTHTIPLTPEEKGQLSMFGSDDFFVRKQQEDIEELSSMFKQMLTDKSTDIYEQIISSFEKAYKGMLDFKAVYKFNITDKNKTLMLEINNDNLEVYYGDIDKTDVIIQLNYDTLTKIQSSRMTFQRAFMTGEITCKGNFKLLYTLDQIFKFSS